MSKKKQWTDEQTDTLLKNTNRIFMAYQDVEDAIAKIKKLPRQLIPELTRLSLSMIKQGNAMVGEGVTKILPG